LDHVVGALGRAQNDRRNSDRGGLMAPHKLAKRSGIALASAPHELILDVVDPASPLGRAVAERRQFTP
jgi:hypothetical protein